MRKTLRVRSVMKRALQTFTGLMRNVAKGLSLERDLFKAFPIELVDPVLMRA